MTELVFILDRSGSMSGLEADTIGGFNSMIAKQKKEVGEALVSTVLFDHESVVIHDRLPLCEVPPLTEKEYFTCGCTALLDAVGGAIHHKTAGKQRGMCLNGTYPFVSTNHPLRKIVQFSKFHFSPFIPYAPSRLWSKANSASLILKMS